jgi:hypothetical protein
LNEKDQKQVINIYGNYKVNIKAVVIPLIKNTTDNFILLVKTNRIVGPYLIVKEFNLLMYLCTGQRRHYRGMSMWSEWCEMPSPL